MGEYEVMHACDKAGISLSLNEDGEKVIASPASKLTPDLKAAIKEAKDGILRQLYFSQANRWTREKAGDERAAQVFEEHAFELNTLWNFGSLEEFRRSLRRIAQRSTARGEA